MDHFDLSGSASRDFVERRFRDAYLKSVRARLKVQERMERMEHEIEWTRLVASTLVGLCIEKGLVTADEFEARMKTIERAQSEAQAAAEPPPAPVVRRRRSRPHG